MEGPLRTSDLKPGDEPVPETASGTEPNPAKAKGARAAGAPGGPRRQDPVTGWLTVAIMGVVILWLAGVASALVFGVFNRSGAPRTQVERDIAYFSGQVQSGKANSRTFASYVDALIRAGQLSKADSALKQALQTAKTDKSYLYAEQAAVSLAQRDYRGASSTADKAMSEANKELAAFEAENLKNNRRKDAGAVLPDSYAKAALLKARALVALKDFAGAIKMFDADLAVQPTDADVLVARGEAKIQTGDKTGAESDFRAALKFVPDYQPALDGLKQIGAAK